MIAAGRAIRQIQRISRRRIALTSHAYRQSSIPFKPMSTSPNPNIRIPFTPNLHVTSVVLDETAEPGDAFTCEEEPHVLSPETGYGYYPITLGQQLDGGKLEVVRKLGWAGFSSAWLARTLRDQYPMNYVTVKVLTVVQSFGVMKGYTREVQSLRAIKETSPDHPGYKHCLHLLEMTSDESRHGIHVCLITNPLGRNMTTLRVEHGGVFPLVMAKRIVKQTLLALDYIHRECGLVHTDIKPGNILVDFGNQEKAITGFLQKCPSQSYEPRIEPQLSPDPIITVKSEPLPNFGLEPDASNLNICLIDFGAAQQIGKERPEEVQPVLLRAPEVILGHSWSAPVDIWSVGCLAFEFITGKALFQLWHSSSMTLEASHLQRILEMIGPFESTFVDRCSRREEFFDNQGSLLHLQGLSPKPLEDCISHYKVLDGENVLAAAKFIRRCLTIDPLERPTALSLLEDDWLKHA